MYSIGLAIMTGTEPLNEDGARMVKLEMEDKMVQIIKKVGVFSLHRHADYRCLMHTYP